MRGTYKPLEANTERKKVLGGERWSDEPRREGQRKGKRCNEGNSCNELPGQKQEGHSKL